MPHNYQTSEQDRAHISIVMPCYNEEAIIGYTIPRLMKAFERSGYRLELIAVDNGSWDRTGEIIKDLAAQWDSLILHRVEVNQGYGYGVISGVTRATAPWVGVIPADGQVDAEDVVRLYEAVVVTDGQVFGKVRRRFRMDGFHRDVVSFGYNLLFRLLWPQIRSSDINGNPKIMPRQAAQVMNLKSKDFLIDPEMMIKSHHMGLRVLELNVFGRMRGNGESHVRMGTAWEFFRYLLRFRFSREWKAEFNRVAEAMKEPAPASPAHASEPMVSLEKSENLP